MSSTTTTTTTTTPIVLVEPAHSDVLAALSAVRDDLNAALVERGTVIDILLCALLAKAHAILLGPPGTGKSTAIEALDARIGDGGSTFKLLMGETTDEAQIFGPQSIPALMNDEFRRALKYGVGKRFWFLDEIWKSNNAVLNALLKALEARQYDNDGKTVQLELESCFGASNEPPSNDSLRALRDRFSLVFWVDYVSDRGFLQLARLKRAGVRAAVNARISLEQLQQLQALRPTVVVPEHIDTLMIELRRELREKGVVVSDRRLLAGYDILQAYALLRGRLEVREADLSILAHVLWTQEHERETVAQVIADMNGRDQQGLALVTRARAMYSDAMSQWASASDDDKGAVLITVHMAMRKVQNEMTALLEDATRDAAPLDKLTAASNELTKLLRQVKDML